MISDAFKRSKGRGACRRSRVVVGASVINRCTARPPITVSLATAASRVDTRSEARSMMSVLICLPEDALMTTLAGILKQKKGGPERPALFGHVPGRSPIGP